MSRLTRAVLLAMIVVGLLSLLRGGADRADAPSSELLTPGDADGPASKDDGAPHLAHARQPLLVADGDEERGFVGSLKGTEVAGGLLRDEAGNFLPTPDALVLFEYFLSATGEASRDEITARIRAEIARRLDPPADAQAYAFLDRYLSYREQGRALATDAEDDADLRARFERLRELRRQTFGEEVAVALFGEEEAVAEISIAQREIAADASLDEEEKAARIEDLYAQLPEPVRRAREQTMAALQLRADEARLREQGAGAEEIRRLRVERFGEEAAARLDALDRERAEWDRRLADFRAESTRIRSDRSLTPRQQDAAIARLMAERFAENERIRVEALN